MGVDTNVPYDTMSTNSVRSEPLFTKCCFCIPIRIGCFILGYMNLAFNTFHTLTLLMITTYVGISTHGFDHFDPDTLDTTDQPMPDIETVDKPLLTQIGFLLVMVLCVNIAWLIINIACLVGLHKKRPGPIRVYVGFATGRLLLSLAGFIYLLMNPNGNPNTVISHTVDFCLAAYFIFVYYVYAVQLEKEQANTAMSQAFTNDIVVDKQILVSPKQMLV